MCTVQYKHRYKESVSYLNHGVDGLYVALEVVVKEFICYPLCQARGHLSLQLFHILVPWSDEVPLQDL